MLDEGMGLCLKVANYTFHTTNDTDQKTDSVK